MKSPLSLVDLSIKPLIELTIDALKKLDPKEDCASASNEECSRTTSKKRKRTVTFSSSRKEKYLRKRSKRESTPFYDATASNREDESEEDDETLEKFSVVDEVITLRNFLDCLPQNLWNLFFCLAIKALNGLNFTTTSSVKVRAFELLFCRKVSSFSTRLLSFHIYNKYEKMLLERLRVCRSLRSLEIHYTIQTEAEGILLSSLTRLSHIRAIVLLPNSKQSLHSIIPVLGQNCRLLEELTIPYESKFMSHCKTNIACLKDCTRLQKLLLHSYGCGSEAPYILQLLDELKELKHFFHRELPHALTSIFDKGYKQNYKRSLNLKFLFLSSYSIYTGSQLCYLPEESLIQIATVCSFLEHIKLVKPPDLSKVIVLLQFLKHLDIHDCDIKETFANGPLDGSFTNLMSLSLMNTDYIDYSDILLLSNSCPQLKHLEITSCNLFWSNDLANTRYLFPNLQKLKILSNFSNGQSEPKFVLTQKLYIDRTLTKLLLSSYKVLEHLYLEFDLEGLANDYVDHLPSKVELIVWIGRCKHLKSLMLLNCPNVGYEVVKAIIESCPNLTNLINIEKWGIPSDEIDLILRRYSHMFV